MQPVVLPLASRSGPASQHSLRCIIIREAQAACPGLVTIPRYQDISNQGICLGEKQEKKTKITPEPSRRTAGTVSCVIVLAGPIEEVPERRDDDVWMLILLFQCSLELSGWHVCCADEYIHNQAPISLSHPVRCRCFGSAS